MNAQPYRTSHLISAPAAQESERPSLPPVPASRPLSVDVPFPDGLGGLVGEGPLTLAVVIEDELVCVVLRSRADPDRAVRVQVEDGDAEYLIRALAGALRYLNQGHGCPACTHGWADEWIRP